MISKSDRGAAAVEFALVMPILLALVFGIIDFGRVYFTTSTLSHAAREGVRVVALGGTAGAGETRAIAAASGVTGASAAVDNGGVPAGDNYECTFGQPTTLTLQAPFEYVTPLGELIAQFTASDGSGFDDRTLSATASMRCGG